MRKVTGIILAVIMASVLLGGCYSKSCDQPQQPMSMKGEG
ncbi:hypothetical protein AQULUS_18030 [Aquicella lusitana]|uniref:Lipoprotein n=1 Tax=Aquicella lusitana TaxID=254246 RepID=A0A370H3C1_9COXI|nr:hypothetical protein C8D86_10210 [Aquicella lusitana]VVC74040.1 hypothetical protein AQULUS_18030 [Aquicella lusitana]